ncbi:MAG: lipoyl(octanoyl) transferase LipB [Phycisphaeraceae bacterium]
MCHPSLSKPLRVVDWGRRDYASSLAAQRELQDAVIAGEAPDTLVLVEHDPVITLTPRAAKLGHVLAPPEQLARLGIERHETDRGGDVTYHGPGQLVAYPILHLHRFDLNLSKHMRLLESAVIDTAAAFGIEAHREAGYTGVWVRPDTEGPARKLCAMGVRIRKHVTMHGLALNVRTDLSHFQTIVPCGLSDRSVTSLHELLGEDAPDMTTVKQTLTEQFQRALADRAAADKQTQGDARPPISHEAARHD